MTIDRAVLAFAGLVVLVSLGLAQFHSPMWLMLDGLGRSEPDSGLVYGLLPGRSAFQTIGRQGGSGLPMTSSEHSAKRKGEEYE